MKEKIEVGAKVWGLEVEESGEAPEGLERPKREGLGKL